MRDGLIDVLEALENDNGEELQLQLKVFNEHKEEDFDEFAQRLVNGIKKWLKVYVSIFKGSITSDLNSMM